MTKDASHTAPGATTRLPLYGHTGPLSPSQPGRRRFAQLFTRHRLGWLLDGSAEPAMTPRDGTRGTQNRSRINCCMWCVKTKICFSIFTMCCQTSCEPYRRVAIILAYNIAIKTQFHVIKVGFLWLVVHPIESYNSNVTATLKAASELITGQI